jgi:hypothetical protein
MAPSADVLPPTPAPAQNEPQTLKGHISTKVETVKQSLDTLDKDPLQRIWRGDEEGKIKLEVLPDFGEGKLAKRQWIKVRLAHRSSRRQRLLPFRTDLVNCFLVFSLFLGAHGGRPSVLGQVRLYGGCCWSHHRPRPSPPRPRPSFLAFLSSPFSTKLTTFLCDSTG